MKWWRSRYVQHLEAENAELRETVKRMLNPQWRYLLYGETIPASEAIQKRSEADKPPERVKLKGRKSWQEIAPLLEYAVSPQAVIDRKKSEREAAIAAAQEN